MISINRNKFKLVYFGIILVFSASIYLYSAKKIGMNRDQKFFIHFDSSQINGELEYVKIKYHLCTFKIKGEVGEYFFDPITSDLNYNEVFEYIAVPGDLINKKAFSDTLELKKNGKIYQYNFRKFSY